MGKAPTIGPTQLPASVYPGRLPLLGNLHQIAIDMPGVLRHMERDLGPLCWLDMGADNQMLVWTDRRALTLFDNKITSSATDSEHFGRVAGRSLIATDGSGHRRMRQIMNRPFTPRGLTTTGIGEQILRTVTDRVRRIVRAERLTIASETYELALDVVFGIIGIPRQELPMWRKRYAELLLGLIGLRLDVPGSPQWRSRRAARWLDRELSRHLRELSRQPETHGLVTALTRGRDDAGRSMDEREIVHNLRVLALAGHETSGAAMAWMTAYAAIRPCIWDALCGEALTSDVPSSPADLSSFPFAQALFREVVRYHPPAYLRSRLLCAPMEMAGREIPSGTVAMVPIWLLSRDPSLYRQPDRFDPWRWLHRQRPLSAQERCQFGGGPHFCLGYHTALLEAVQYIVALTQELHTHKRRLRLVGSLPRERYLPVLGPRRRDTRARVVSS